MMKQNLIQKTLIALCLTAIASLSACTQTTPAQPTYAEHLYTKSNANGTVEIVKGAPTGADANLEMTNAKKVTHTFSDGSSVTWDIEDNTVFFNKLDLDYGITTADKMFDAVLDGEIRLHKIQSRAVLADGTCAGFSIGILCIKNLALEKAPNQTFNFTFASPPRGAQVASEDTKITVRAAVKIWNEKLVASAIHTKLKWVELPSVVGSDTVQIYEVANPNFCGAVNHIGYQKSNNTIAISSYNVWNQPDACPSKLRTVLHEMGHQMGLFHEDSRCDRSTKGPLEFAFYSTFYERDNQTGPKLTVAQEQYYLETKCNLVQGGLSDDVTEIVPGSSYDITPYDVGSIMHHRADKNLWKFNKPQSGASGPIGINFRFKLSEGQTTMSDSQKAQLKLIGNSEVPSAYDIFAIADLYRCIPTKSECQ
jgi:Astacin (Peptidase family M12A)